MANIEKIAAEIVQKFLEYDKVRFEPCKETFIDPFTQKESVNHVGVEVRLLRLLADAVNNPHKQ